MILNDEQQMVRDTARAFAQDKLAPFAAEWDREHKFPADALTEMASLGFLALQLLFAVSSESMGHHDSGPDDWWRVG